jgi:hypothetical protein
MRGQGSGSSRAVSGKATGAPDPCCVWDPCAIERSKLQGNRCCLPDTTQTAEAGVKTNYNNQPPQLQGRRIFIFETRCNPGSLVANQSVMIPSPFPCRGGSVRVRELCLLCRRMHQPPFGESEKRTRPASTNLSVSEFFCPFVALVALVA